MKTYPVASDVVSDLGQDFLVAFVSSVQGAERDRLDHMAEHPDWYGTFSQRHVASFLHERIWGRMLPTLRDMPGVKVIDQEPERSVSIGSRYHARFKRHRLDGAISTFPTDSAVRFWSNRAEPISPEVEVWSLALGYLWQDDQVKHALISLRESMDKIVWVRPLHLALDASGAQEVSALTVESVDLPDFDLTTLIDEDVEEAP